MFGEDIWGFIKSTFFYDLRSTIISIFFLVGVYCFCKLLKDNGEKVNRSMKYLTMSVMCFAVVAILYS